MTEMNDSPLMWEQQIRNDLVSQELYHNEDVFRDKNALKSDDEKGILLRRMRMERDFYKKILEEKFREKHPQSYRYVDAKIRIEILNRNGKILKSMINE